MSRFGQIRIKSVRDTDHKGALINQIRTAASKQAVGDNYIQIMDNLKEKVETIATAHYRHTVNQLRQLTSRAGLLPSSVATGGSFNIPFRRLDRTMSSVRTVYWRPLKPDYLERKPFSFQYWRKYTPGEKTLGPAMAAQNPRTAEVKVYYLKDPPRSHHKDRINVQVDLYFQNTLPPILHSIITEPFALGSTKSQGLDINLATDKPREGLNRLWPEMDKNRPFMRLVSKKLGEDMRKKLRKI